MEHALVLSTLIVRSQPLTASMKGSDTLAYTGKYTRMENKKWGKPSEHQCERAGRGCVIWRRHRQVCAAAYMNVLATGWPLALCAAATSEAEIEPAASAKHIPEHAIL